MKKTFVLPVVALFLTAVASCNAPGAVQRNLPDFATKATSTAASITLLPLEVATAAPTKVELTFTPAAFKASGVQATRLPPEQPCNQAAPGPLFDVTIPDDTILAPGEGFSKTWRIQNQGSCDWNRQYALVWFSGENFQAGREQPFMEAVPSGSLVDLTLDMMAPDLPGSYWSYWMLRSDDGQLFGIGPAGNSPFWVRIQVIEPGTATPQASPIPTSTAIVLLQREIALSIGQGLDLDYGASSTESQQSDLLFQPSGSGGFEFQPVNGARLAFMDTFQPDQSDCLLSSPEEDLLLLPNAPVGMFYCYRTNQGLPGVYQVVDFDAQTGTANLEFVTWAVP